MNTILRILLWPITIIIRLINKLIAHFFNHPNGGLHLIIGIQFIIILGMGTWIALEIVQRNQAASFKPNFPKIAVEAVQVKVGTFEQFVTAVGTLRSNHSIVVKPEIDAKVKEIFVKSGQAVKKGDKLLSLDDSLYTARVKEAEAKLVYANGTGRTPPPPRVLRKNQCISRVSTLWAYVCPALCERRLPMLRTQA